MRRLALVLLASTALAEDDGIRRVSVAVGQTVEHEVGYAIGVACDDDVVEATMKSKTSETNVLVLLGKREGKTTCRAGTDPTGVSQVFEITVTPKRPAPRRPR